MSSSPVSVPAGPQPPPRPPLLPSSRYRHPGDVIRLILAGLLLAGAFAASAAAVRWLLGPAAPVPGGLGTAGQIGDDLLARLWAEVDKLHRAGIAHRSLRAANV